MAGFSHRFSLNKLLIDDGIPRRKAKLGGLLARKARKKESRKNAGSLLRSGAVLQKYCTACILAEQRFSWIFDPDTPQPCSSQTIITWLSWMGQHSKVKLEISSCQVLQQLWEAMCPCGSLWFAAFWPWFPERTPPSFGAKETGKLSRHRTPRPKPVCPLPRALSAKVGFVPWEPCGSCVTMQMHPLRPWRSRCWVVY